MAYRSAPASIYTYLAFALTWSWLFFAHVPDAATLHGLALVAVAGWFVI